MVSNEVKKKRKNYFYQLILSSIKEKRKLPVELSKQRAYYYTKDLKTSGLIVSRGFGVWDLTELYQRLEANRLVKKTNLHTLVKPNTCKRVSKKNVRGHAFGFRLKLPKIANWGNKHKILTSMGLNPTLLKTGVSRIVLDGNKTQICNGSIVMHFDSDYSFIDETGKGSYKEAVNYFLRKIIKLENKLGVSFKIQGKYKFKCFKHHFAHLNNVVAERCKLDGKSYYIRRESGSVWLIIDFSNKIPETETVDPETAVYDMDAKIKPLFDEVDRNPNFITDMRKEVKELTSMIKELKDQNKMLYEIVKEKDLNTGRYIY